MHPVNITAFVTAFMGLIALVALDNDDIFAFMMFLALFGIGTLVMHVLFQIDKSKQSNTSTNNNQNNEKL
jgi:energy-converting hydrogenase Eha subunit H